MNGVINLYKEKGYTSFHAVAVVRAITGEKKVGHTGTLDPDACGVLPVCLGKATKLMGQLTDTDKSYDAVMLLGKRTDTQDISGNVIEEMPRDAVRDSLTEKMIKDAFCQMTGEIKQLPPMYSAVKVGGVKLVDAARKGKSIERNERSVTVYGYEKIKVDLDSLTVSFSINCSKGTYVRTICEDIGKLVGVPACLLSLERTRAAGLDVEESITISRLEELKAEGRLSDCVIPVDRFFLEYPGLVVKNEFIVRLIYGNYMYSEDILSIEGNVDTPGIFRVYDDEGKFYALYKYDAESECYKCEKMFSEQE